MAIPSNTKSAKETQELAGRISKGLKQVRKKQDDKDLTNEELADEIIARNGITLLNPDKLDK